MRISSLPRSVLGFAMLEVLLAVLVISIIAFGSFSLVAKYRTVNSITPIVTDMSNIALAYAPFQTPFAADRPIIGASSFGLTTDFLASVPIPSNRLRAADASTSYVRTGLSVGSSESIISFAQSASTSSDITYFVMGLKLNQDQLPNLLQNVSRNFSVFYSSPCLSLKSSTPANSLPTCSSSTGCVYCVYLVSPKIDSASSLVTGYIAQ